MFELPTTPVGGIGDTSHMTVIQRIQQTYDVGVMLKPHYRSQSSTPFQQCTVVVRGSVQNTKLVKEATIALYDHFTNNIGVSFSSARVVEFGS